MKKNQRCLVVFVCCIVSALLMLSPSAFASSDSLVVSNYITIYNQDSAWAGISYSGGTLEGCGCGLFSLNHAMQWVGINPVPSPSSMAETDRNRVFYSNQASYFSGSTGVYGYTATDIWNYCYDLDSFRARLIEAFSQGSAVTLHVAGPNSWADGQHSGGHYCLGIGISNDGSKVHIVDSSSGTTLGIIRDSSYNAYYYNGSAFVALNKNWGVNDTIRAVSGGSKTAYASGCEYWVDIGFIQQNQVFYNDKGNRAPADWTVVINNPNGNTNSYNKTPEKPLLTINSADGGYATRVTWNMTNYTSYFDIHIRDKDGNVVLDDTTGRTTYYQTQLPVGSYYAYVGAVNTNADEWKVADSDYTWFRVVEHNAIPSKPELSVNATDNLHDTVLTWNVTDNTEHCDVHIYDSSNTVVEDKGVGVSTSYSTRLKAGSYTAYVGAVNSYADDWKWNDSDRVSFTVTNAYPRPGKPVLTIEAKDDRQDTVFSWATTENTSYYDVHICNEQGVLISTDGVGMNTEFRKRLSAGIYWAYVGAVNTSVEEWTTNDSDRVRFHVIEYGSTPDKPVLSVNAADDTNSVQFAWNETANTWRYDLHVRDIEGNTVLDESFYSPTEYSTTLSDGSYYAYVGAVNGYAEPWTWNDSERVYFQIGETIPMPINLTVTPSDELLSIMSIETVDELEAQTAYYAAHIREHLTVEVTYNDGSTKEVDDYGVTAWIEHDDSKPLKYEFDYTVTYGNLSDTTGISITLDPVPIFGEPDFTLPAAISTIYESAFEGIAATIVYIPDNCTSIGKWAFKDCTNLTQIRIPANCAIGTDAFSGCANVVIFGKKGSAAESYANSHSNCTFVAE